MFSKSGTPTFDPSNVTLLFAGGNQVIKRMGVFLYIIMVDLREALGHKLAEYVTHTPFDNLAVLLSLLYYADQSEMPAHAAWESWSPDSVQLIEEFGGTNCVGATTVFKEILRELGIDAQEIISPSNRLPEGVNYQEVPFQHMGLLVYDQSGEAYYLVDPGLGLVMPVPINTETVEIDDRSYYAVMENEEGTLEVLKPDGSKIFVDFILLPENGNPEQLVQKPLLRATTFFKMETFTTNGKKKTSLKIDIYKEKISFLVNGSIYSFSFDELDDMWDDENLLRLVEEMDYLSMDEVKQRLSSVVIRRREIVSMWFEGLQRQYYLDHPEKLSPWETSWVELEQRGYKGGGVVVCLVNEQNQVMMYTVPEGKAKPYIDRFPGQKNLFVETAEETVPKKGVASLENLTANLARAFQEEIGIDVPEKGIYREVDYISDVRARVLVFQVDSKTIESVRQHQQKRKEETGIEELGAIEWVDVTNLESQWLEPNAQRILQKLIEEEIITPKAKDFHL